MTFIATLVRTEAHTPKEYKQIKRRMIMSGAKISRDTKEATYFNRECMEVVLIKGFVT